MSNSRTQIVTTVGPASNKPETIREMIKSNMDAVRLNFFWGNHEEHQQSIETVREIAKELDRHIPIIPDLSGPREQDQDTHTYDKTAQSVITEKDKKDLEFVLGLGVEYVAMSYVGSGSDIDELRSLIESHNGKAKIIAKIERKEAVENIEEIAEKSDAIMVARGDLGQAIPLETMPFVQRDITKVANKHKKPVIVATEMMTSMIKNDTPVRADVTDVAYAVISGADAVMVSNETAVGNNPVKVVDMLERVVLEAEKHMSDRELNPL